MGKIAEEFGDIPLINDWDAVFDKGLSVGTTNVQLFGSRKPHHEPYKLTYAYEMVLDMNDKAFMMNPVDISEGVTFELFKTKIVKYIYIRSRAEN